MIGVEVWEIEVRRETGESVRVGDIENEFFASVQTINECSPRSFALFRKLERCGWMRRVYRYEESKGEVLRVFKRDAKRRFNVEG